MINEKKYIMPTLEVNTTFSILCLFLFILSFFHVSPLYHLPIFIIHYFSILKPI